MDDIEQIKNLKARYCRLLDTKEWDDLRQVFADDAVLDATESGGEVINGADAFIEFVRAALGGSVTVHHCHTPEIAVSTPTSATGIWAMEDRVRFPDGTELLGFGHYHETYQKIDGAWRISAQKLTRLRMDFTKPDGG